MRTALWPLLLVVSLAGCSAGDAGTSSDVARSLPTAPAQMDQMASRTEMKASQAAAGAGASENQPMATGQLAVAKNIAPIPVARMNRAVIRTGQLTVRVDSVEKSERAAGKLIASIGGYVEGSHSDDLAGENPTITMSLRVPVDQFDNVIAQCETLGVRLAKQMSSDDVTSQLVDMDARSKVMRAEEDSLVAMLRQSRNLDTTMSLQSRLTELRGTIESIQGQRKALAGQAALSKLDLTLQQSTHLVVTPNDDSKWLASVWADATNKLYSIGRLLATAGVYFLVFSPLIAIAGLALRRRRPTAVKAYTSEV